MLRLAELAAFLGARIQESGDGVPEKEVRRRFSLDGAGLTRDLKLLARIAPRSGGLLMDKGLDAYVERGKVFYFGPLARSRPPRLESRENSDLRAAAGLLAGCFPPGPARLLRDFAGKRQAPRAPGASPAARTAFAALARGRTLIRPGGEALRPVGLAWYQGYPCLEVLRVRAQRGQRPRFLLRLDRFPPCRLGPPVETPADQGRRPSRQGPGTMARVRLTGSALKLFKEGGGRGRVRSLAAGSREELLRKVLRLGSEARVLNPSWLITALRQRASEVLALYKTAV